MGGRLTALIRERPTASPSGVRLVGRTGALSALAGDGDEVWDEAEPGRFGLYGVRRGQDQLMQLGISKPPDALGPSRDVIQERSTGRARVVSSSARMNRRSRTSPRSVLDPR